MTAFQQLIGAMRAGRHWSGMGDPNQARELMAAVYAERYHGAAHYRDRYQLRANRQKKEEAASYAGWITADNPTSGAYQGTSFVWFPGAGGSIAVLVIGTDGFWADSHILGRPGHGRRLRALRALHQGRLWVKPDFLDLNSRVPETISTDWPAAEPALKTYGQVIYAAIPVASDADANAVEDLLDLFFAEHGTPLTGKARTRWEARQQDIASAIFPSFDETRVLSLLNERRFLILEGPPGTGKTRWAIRLAKQIGGVTQVQFHPARTYEDFIVGLFPRPTSNGLAFEVRAGDLLRANQAAGEGPHVLLIDEINRADLHQALAYSALSSTDQIDSVLAYPQLGDLGDERRPHATIATLATGRRRIRLVLAGLPFGLRSPSQRDRALSSWRELPGRSKSSG